MKYRNNIPSEHSWEPSLWTFPRIFTTSSQRTSLRRSQVLRNNVRRDSHSEGSQAWSQRKLHSDYHREFTETFTGMFIVNITAYSLWYSLRIRSEYAVKVFFDLGTPENGSCYCLVYCPEQAANAVCIAHISITDKTSGQWHQVTQNWAFDWQVRGQYIGL